MAVTLFVPAGRDDVTNVAVPFETKPEPIAVEELMLKKLTGPVAVDGLTVAVNVTLAPWLMLEAEAESVVVVVDLDAVQAVKSLFMSTNPSPVTWL